MEMSFLVKHAFLCQQRQWTNKKPFTAMDMDVHWFYPWWINVNARCILTHYPLAAPYHLFLFGLFHDAEVHLISLCAVCQILIKKRQLNFSSIFWFNRYMKLTGASNWHQYHVDRLRGPNPKRSSNWGQHCMRVEVGPCDLGFDSMVPG